MIALDFFSGAGGLTKGLSLAGITVLAGLDIDPSFKTTFEYNNIGSKFIVANIKKLSPAELLSEIPDLSYDDENLLFAGCAPCQAFSKQRKSQKKRSDEDALMYFGKLVEYFLPGQVLVENVKGIKQTQIFNDFEQLLYLNGYKIWTGILNAKDFGVPQNRKRLVLIASRGATVNKPIPTHGGEKKPYVTVKTAISHFPELKAGSSDETVPNHSSAKLSQLNIIRIMNTPKNGGSWSSWPENLKLDCHRKVSGYSDVYGRMSWDTQAPTITCRCISLSNGRYGHPEQDRAISLREAAALQSFPDDYVFFGSQGSVAKQIGNAVPVQLAKALGIHIKSIRSNSS